MGPAVACAATAAVAGKRSDVAFQVMPCDGDGSMNTPVIAAKL
jgi:hypothetical protein